MEWYGGEDAGDLERSELNELVENWRNLHDPGRKIEKIKGTFRKSDQKVVMEEQSWKTWKSNQKIVMDEQLVHNVVMDKELVRKIVMDEKIGPEGRDG